MLGTAWDKKAERGTKNDGTGMGQWGSVPELIGSLVGAEGHDAEEGVGQNLEEVGGGCGRGGCMGLQQTPGVFSETCL